MMRCAQCHTARYCSRECQRTDWKAGGHRGACGALSFLAAAGMKLEFVPVGALPVVGGMDVEMGPGTQAGGVPIHLSRGESFRDWVTSHSRGQWLLDCKLAVQLFYYCVENPHGPRCIRLPYGACSLAAEFISPNTRYAGARSESLFKHLVEYGPPHRGQWLFVPTAATASAIGFSSDGEFISMRQDAWCAKLSAQLRHWAATLKLHDRASVTHTIGALTGAHIAIHDEAAKKSGVKESLFKLFGTDFEREGSSQASSLAQCSAVAPWSQCA